jgi:hypothetical protein
MVSEWKRMCKARGDERDAILVYWTLSVTQHTMMEIYLCIR